MTTIISTRDMMVSDSRVSVDSDNPLIDDYIFMAEKIYPKGKALIGCCGSNDDIEKFVKWYGSRRKKPIISDKEFAALVLTNKGIYHYDATLSKDKVNEPFTAIGSGCNAAKGAMYMGADPIKATEIVFLVDKHSGPPIQIVKLDEQNK